MYIDRGFSPHSAILVKPIRIQHEAVKKKRLVSLGDVSELSNMSICRLFCH